MQFRSCTLNLSQRMKFLFQIPTDISVHFPGHLLAFSASFLPSKTGIFYLQYSSYFASNQVIFVRRQISSIPQFADSRTANVRSAYLLKHSHIPIKTVIKCVITLFAGLIFTIEWARAADELSISFSMQVGQSGHSSH